MKIVFFAHPDFLGHKSMVRFSKLLQYGMQRRGHNVEMWMPEPVVSKLTRIPFIQKWLGYVDQYILFPAKVKRLLKTKDQKTLFVFTDQALGPWVSLVADRPHVIHCHDFLALRSALGEFPENRTGWTGQILQRYIRNGFSHGRNFISVSMKTREDLGKFALSKPVLSEVVYNGLHQAFGRQNADSARARLGQLAQLDLSNGYLLHVGGNAWYKNRMGVIEIYEAWRRITNKTLPLILIGQPLLEDAKRKVSSSPYASDIHCLSEINDSEIVLAYAGAVAFIFPSLAEGFGWPIAEAMAAGAPVITTGEAPMSEVARDAGYLIPKQPSDPSGAKQWAAEAARTVERVASLSPEERERAIRKGVENALRFETEHSLDQIEAIYNTVLTSIPNSGVK